MSGLAGRCEKKRGVENATQVFGLSNWKNGKYCGWGRLGKRMPGV